MSRIALNQIIIWMVTILTIITGVGISSQVRNVYNVYISNYPKKGVEGYIRAMLSYNSDPYIAIPNLFMVATFVGCILILIGQFLGETETGEFLGKTSV